MTLTYAIFVAIKFSLFATFAIGLGIGAALGVAQFAAIRHAEPCFVIRVPGLSRASRSPSRRDNNAGWHAGAIAGRSLMPLVPATISSLALMCFGAVALHPRLVSVIFG